MKYFGSAALCCTFFICTKSYAGIMLNDIDVQDYRDFAENLGNYNAGRVDAPVYRKDGSLSDYLDFPMPDFGGVSSLGYATLISPSYIVSVKHNSGYKTVAFGNGAQYATAYTLINRNELSTEDFHTPRLNKVVTEAAPYSYVIKSDFIANYQSRYSWYARVGTGTQEQINNDQTERVRLTGAYDWKSGGTISAASVREKSYNSYLRYYNLGPDDANTTPLSIGANAGDSGSPVFAWDDIEQQWKLVAVHVGYDQDSGLYKKRAIAGYIPGDFIASVQAANTSPDVIDVAGNGTIFWDNTAITQYGSSWSWAGLSSAYASAAPSTATNAELDATKDLRFNGAGGLITLNTPINMGAGKLQFSNNYTVASADGVNATWAGGGIEVDADKEVLWQVNGLASDALHKIGAGTLHINAIGTNPGSLNVGEGTVILDQQADASGNKQAFSSVTLVSGRPTVVLNDESQVATDQIFFGYRGGRLDVNGNTINFIKINHTDSGARLVNHSQDASTVNLNGYHSKDISINTLDTNNRNGTPGSIYAYKKANKPTEYFQLQKSKYVYYPQSKKTTSEWTYLGTDLDEAVNHRLTQLNVQLFLGFFGETLENELNGVMNINVLPEQASALTALTGGMNLNGNLRVEKGTTILSGQPVEHAGGVVVDDDWNTSLFRADQINVGTGAHFQVGEYAGVKANIVAADSSTLSFGYNDSELAGEKSWRCYSAIYSDDVSCNQPVRSADALALLPASEVEGDVQLANNASLYLGKVNYQGDVTSTGSSVMTLDANANWTMTGNSNVSSLLVKRGSTLSMVPSGSWSAKTLNVDTLDATGLNLMLGVKPSTLESDKLIVKNSVSGGDNLLDVSLLIGSEEDVALTQDLVMVDAPAGTSHSYFSFADSYSGFSVYTPNYQVKDDSDRVLWVLKSNKSAEPEVTPEPEPTPVPEVTPVPEPTPAPEVTPEPASAPDASSADNATAEQAAVEKAKAEEDANSKAEAEAKAKAEAEEKAKEEAAKAEEEAKKPAFNPDDWFSVYDNLPLIQRTRALIASRQYIFSEAVSQLHNRTDSLHASPESSGSWATIEQKKGHFLGLDVNQQTLKVGWDTRSDTQTAGISASYTQGEVKGEGHEKHRLATVGTYYSWQADAGWFFDAASRYMYLNQEITLDPALNINGMKKDSHMLAGSLRTGYEFALADDTLFISPFVGVTAGVMSGYTLKGEDASVSLSSSTPYFTSSGFMVQKRGLGALMPNINVSASLAYQYSPGTNGSTTTLSDRQSNRQYSAWSDNRYRGSVGLEGIVAPGLSLNAKVESSFGGKFKTDYSGMIGLSYLF
ncbi:S6 family peptidase [Pantoea vagans]|uniref:S6 family peptidase n=1 Tax=Pantoea vagans TaxID=470934 RepID=UPI00076B2A04|nr:S6 family peptidase [Pantoea vagans]AMG56696.1 autotransporter outer membrane beta-barrel domain-containing protein [Pantoea vagans]